MTYLRKPAWLKTNLQSTENFTLVNKIVKENNLHTICTSGRCPNMCECWNRGTATFMILGEICTRACRFCNTLTGKPLPVDPEEPRKVAESIRLMKLKLSSQSFSRKKNRSRACYFFSLAIASSQVKPVTEILFFFHDPLFQLQ